MLSLLALGLPLAWTLGAVASALVLLEFNPAVTEMMVSRVFDMSLNYTLMAVPLFILMAGILQRSGIADGLFRSINSFSGGLRGGIGIGTIIANAIMASMVGIIGAEIVTFGLIALPEMLKQKYKEKLAVGIICAGGGLAVLIPPSVIFILYGMMTSTPIGDLFLAGVLPGCLLASLFILYIILYCWRNPDAAPLIPKEERSIPLRVKLKEMKNILPALALATVVLGSLYAGIATPSEAAGIGVGGATVVALINRRFSWAMARDCMFETLRISSMLMWLFFGAQTIIGFYTLAGGTQFVTNTIKAMELGTWGTLLLMNLIWILLGCFLDWVGILFLTMPIFLPIILEFGLNPVWFGVVFCVNMQVSFLSPPFAPAIFYAKSVTPEHITTSDIIKAVIPFLIITLVGALLVNLFPVLSLFLGSLGGR
jgi:tripartite ATP-independent transporter DctM subunit